MMQNTSGNVEQAERPAQRLKRLARSLQTHKNEACALVKLGDYAGAEHHILKARETEVMIAAIQREARAS